MRSSYWLNLILASLVVISIYSLTAWKPHVAIDRSKTPHEKAFFTNIHFQQFNEKGELNKQFVASKFSILSDQKAFFSKPIFSMMTTDHTPWTASSKTGMSYNNGEKIELIGSVHLTQWPTSTSPKTDITTASLWLFPKNNLASTAEIIHLDRPGMKISGKGMHADLKKNIFSLESQTAGFYQPNNQEPPYQFQSRSMQYNGKNHVATYRDNVHVSKMGEKIDGDTVTVHTGAKNEIHDLLALGNPAHYQSIQKNKPEPLKASAESIHFDTQQRIAILRRRAKVIQGKDRLQGDYVWYDTKQGLAKTHSAAGDKTVINLEPDTKKK